MLDLIDTKGKKDIKSMTLEEVTAEMTALGEKSFRAKQLYDWLHVKLAESFDDMSTLSKDLRQKLKDITAQQALLLDQVLEHMDDEILNAQLKAMMDEKQALQEQIAAAEQSQTHNAAQESRMAELREWMAKLEVNQQYSDEQVRMVVERITVVDAETIRIRFRYPGAELEKKL